MSFRRMRPTNSNLPYQYPKCLRSCAGLSPHRSPTRRALPLAYYPIRSGNPHTRTRHRHPSVQSCASTMVIHLSSSTLFGIHIHLPMRQSFGFAPNPFVCVRLRQALSGSICHPLASPSPSARPASVFTLAHAVHVSSRFETPCASLRAATRIARQGTESRPLSRCGERVYTSSRGLRSVVRVTVYILICLLSRDRSSFVSQVPVC